MLLICRAFFHSRYWRKWNISGMVQSALWASLKCWKTVHALSYWPVPVCRGMFWTYPINALQESRWSVIAFYFKRGICNSICQALVLGSIAVGLNLCVTAWGTWGRSGPFSQLSVLSVASRVPQCRDWHSGTSGHGFCWGFRPAWGLWAQLLHKANAQTGKGWPVFQSDWLGGLNKQLDVWGLI